MNLYQIPINSSPNQTFTSVVPVDGKNINLSFFLRFSEVAGYWLMDIGDATTDTPLLASIPLVPGVYPADNLLGQYAYLGIGSAYIVNSTNTTEEWPGESTLGNDWQLVWGDTP